jgi:hypothetical protein
VTVPLKPSCDESVSVSLAVPPGLLIVRFCDDVVTPTESPAPLNATDWGEPIALSVTLIVPIRVPTAVGVKVMEIVQFAAAARLAPQVFVSAKSPEAAIDAMFIAALPVFISVIVWAELVEPTACAVKMRLAGVKVATGVGETPAPVSETICGDPLELSAMVIWPCRLPAAVGVKVTEIAQVELAASVEPQVLLAAKSPEAAMLMILSTACPEFFN